MERLPRLKVLKLFLVAVPALALPFVIRAAVVEGIATATEVSTIGIAYSVIAGLLIYRQFDIPPHPADARRNRRLIGSHSLHYRSSVRDGLGAYPVRLLPRPRHGHAIPAGWARGFLLVSIVAFIMLGSVLEGIPAVVLFGPLVFPIARAMGIQRSALLDGGGPLHGAGSVLTAVRCRLLHCLRDW